MNTFYEYSYDEKSAILYKQYYGDITIEMIESSWLHAFKHKLIPETVKGFVLDYRKAHILVRFEDSGLIPDFYKRHLSYFGGKRIAVVTECPSDVVVPMLVSEHDEFYQSKPFSSIEAAGAWVLNKE